MKNSIYKQIFFTICSIALLVMGHILKSDPLLASGFMFIGIVFFYTLDT